MLKRLASWAMIAGVTLVMLEGALQVGFGALPLAITAQMPQYPARYGIRYDTPHGAREYPAYERVERRVTATTGDLYALSCLSPASAPAFEPYDLRYSRDAHGFRNREPYPQPADLVIVGDSFTAGELVNAPYSEGLSPATLSLGLAGSGTLEQARLYAHFGAPRAPRVTVLAFFGGNDVQDNAHFARLQAEGITAYEAAQRGRAVWEYSVLFHLGLRLRQSLVGRDGGACAYPVQAQDGTPLAFYNAFLVNNSAPPVGEAYERTLTAIADIATQAQAGEGAFLLMYVPYKAQVYWDLLTPTAQAQVLASLPDGVGAGFLQYRDALRDALAQEAQANGWGWLDLTPILQARAQAGQHAYFYADTHWHQGGHDLVREALRDALSTYEAR
jgi:hypothetical protein